MTVGVPVFVARLDRRKIHRVYAGGWSFRMIHVEPPMMVDTSVHILGESGERAFKAWLERSLETSRDYWSDWSLLPNGSALQMLGMVRGNLQTQKGAA